MNSTWLRKRSGQAVIIVAVAILVLAAILMLALDGGGIYLDRRQLQNAADAAALAGAGKLMAVSSSYATMHAAAVGNLVQNIPGTAIPASCSPCPDQKTIGAPGASGVGTLSLGNGYWAELSVLSSYTYQVVVWHVHQDVLAPLHGFSPTVTLSARATAQNADLPYAIVLFQDKAQYATYSNFNINGSPGSVTLMGGGGTDDRGGIFSNASIAPGSDSPSIIFSGGGDLWAVDESAADLSALQSPNRVQGETTAPPPQTAMHLDYPNYPEPAAPSTTYNGSTVLTGTQTVLCPGTYTNQIVVQNGSTAILYPGVYLVQVNGVSVQGTLRTLQASDFNGVFSASCPGLPTLTAMPADPGAIVEITPADNGNSQCNKHLFAVGATANVTLQPSPKYFNISLYIETMPSWQSICTTQPLGTNVVRFSGGACYSIQGAIYGPADNMVMAGSACGSGVGQIVAWTLTLNGSGNLNETYSPSAVPYMKGLIQ
ncbi:MAG TPA: pilus assembly protein TadG-related protein [Candidatus Dormibacteraeota bacterium]